MCLRVRHRFNSLSYRCIHNASALEGFSRVVSDSVVHNYKSAGCPSISTLIFLHIKHQVHKYLVRQRRVVTEHYRLVGLVALVDPACVRGNDLVEESLVAIRTDSYCW